MAEEQINSYLKVLYKLDFKERPVTVDQFLCDPKFLGKATANGKAVYPIWKTVLTEMMAEDSKYLAVFTGAIGTGNEVEDVVSEGDDDPPGRNVGGGDSSGS